jgi:alkaline phosphatase D
MRSFDRRGFLKVGGGLLLVTACGEGGANAGPAANDRGDGSSSAPEAGVEPWAVDPVAFPLGVQAGAAEADRAVFWSFSVGVSRAVLRIWLDEDFGRAPPLVEAPVEPRDGFLKASVSGLRAGAVHRYAFFDDARGVRSAEGRLRSAFPPGLRAPLRLGATACTAIGRAPFTPLPRTAARELDAFCHLGDMSYNDGSVSRADYRRDWARILGNAEYRALLASVGTYITWDDHEIVDAAALSEATPEQIDDAKAAFFEALPVPERPERRFWGSYRWGETAEIFVLDVRHERSEAHIVGEAQMSWLLDALAASPCVFKVIMTSVPIARLPAIWAAAEESWMRYPEDRARLLDHLASRGIRGVVFLAGDYHLGAVWRIEDDGPHAGVYEVLCGPGGSDRSQRWALAQTNEATRRLFFPEGRIDFCTDRWCATFVTLDPDAGRIRVEIQDGETGEVLHDATLEVA